jgi:CRP/FNR family transcriptional regulator, cyclic AMP receptor protein
MQMDDIRTILEACEFFKGLDPAQLASIAPICRPCCYEAGETIYRQGGVGEEIFIIAEGQVVLERDVSVGPRKGTVPVAVLGKGKIIGGWSTLLNEAHVLMLSAVCKRPAVLLAIKGADLRQRMTGDIALGFRILEKLCLLLRERVQVTLGALNSL